MKSSAPPKEPEKDSGKVLSTKNEQPLAPAASPSAAKAVEPRDGNCYWYKFGFEKQLQPLIIQNLQRER
jgi:hypothetical protein